MFKDFLKRWLQKILGFDDYLYWFSIYSINKTKRDKEFVAFMNRIPPTGAILDIGANIGIMTVSFAKRFKDSFIYSFEPMPDNLTALKRVIKRYQLRNISVAEIALGDENGEMKIVMPVINNVRMQGLTHIVDPDRYQDINEGITVTVPVKRLDDIPMLNALEVISAIKIDVENYEYEVLRGGLQLLSRHRPIIYCELWAGERRTKTIKFLEALGFKTEIFDGKRFLDYHGQESTNFIFSPANIQ